MIVKEETKKQRHYQNDRLQLIFTTASPLVEFTAQTASSLVSL
jgi:predicted RNA polymerase sigma factor